MTIEDYLAFHDHRCLLFLATRTCNCWRPKPEE